MCLFLLRPVASLTGLSHPRENAKPTMLWMLTSEKCCESVNLKHLRWVFCEEEFFRWKVKSHTGFKWPTWPALNSSFCSTNKHKAMFTLNLFQTGPNGSRDRLSVYMGPLWNRPERIRVDPEMDLLFYGSRCGSIPDGSQQDTRRLPAIFAELRRILIAVFWHVRHRQHQWTK